jgi:hypothetical protein
MYMQHEVFDLTATGLAKPAKCHANFVRKCAREKLIPFIVASDGTWLFPKSAASTVKATKKERLKLRGHHLTGPRSKLN